jgi:hypothetical protein
MDPIQILQQSVVFIFESEDSISALDSAAALTGRLGFPVHLQSGGGDSIVYKDTDISIRLTRSIRKFAIIKTNEQEGLLEKADLFADDDISAMGINFIISAQNGRNMADVSQSVPNDNCNITAHMSLDPTGADGRPIYNVNFDCRGTEALPFTREVVADLLSRPQAYYIRQMQNILFGAAG